jgi:predicted transcriptional regulator
MKKLSQILENVVVGKLNLTDNEFNEYKKKVDSIVAEFYSDMVKWVKAEGQSMKMMNILPNEEGKNRECSLMTKCNTNLSLLRKIIDWYNVNSFEELINTLNNNKEELFLSTGSKFNDVFKILEKTTELGNIAEDLVRDEFKNLMKKKYDIDVLVYRSPEGSADDMLRGIDVWFMHGTKKITCQVKPLKNLEMIGDEYKILISGRAKSYKTDYIAFANVNKNEVLIFKNKNVKVEGYYYIIPSINKV